MAKPLLTAKRLILVKSEATELIDSAPTTVADALLCVEAEITPEFTIHERPALKPHLGVLPHIVGAQLARWRLVFEIKGNGVAAGAVVLPDFDPVLRACGMKRTDTGAPVTDRTWRPHTPGKAAGAGEVIEASMTLWAYLDGTVHKLTGCRGNLKLEGADGGPFVATAEGIGMLSNDPGGVEAEVILADLAFPTTATFDASLPFPVLNAGLTIDGFAHKFNAFSLDLGNEIKPRPNRNRITGYQGCFLARRSPTGTIDPELELIATEDFQTALEAGRQMVFAAALNSTGAAGFKITLGAPIVQYTSMAFGDREGAVTAQMGFALRESAGDDEFTMALT